MKAIRNFFGCFLLFVALATVGAAAVLAAGQTPSGPSTGQQGPQTGAQDQAAVPAQKKTPPDMLSVYLDAFHFHSGNMKHQMEVHHYCAALDDDFIQCALYDGNTAVAHLIGVEYVISERLFKNLPEEEKRMWHSHAYEVVSGQLIIPDLAEASEHEVMAKLVSTYDKTRHTWNVDMPGNTLPVGIPALMMAFTADGQIDGQLSAKRDASLHVSTEAKKKSRADIKAPPVQPGADAWQKGQIVRLTAKTVAGKQKKATAKGPQKTGKERREKP